MRLTLLALLLGAGGAAQAATAAGLTLSNVWARATPAGVPVGAAYFTITNQAKEPDSLISAASPAAQSVTLHSTTLEGGLSRMRPAGEIVLAPGQTVKVEPGGLHVMLTGLKGPLVAGTRVPLTLTFRRAGAITVQMQVRPATFVSHDQRMDH